MCKDQFETDEGEAVRAEMFACLKAAGLDESLQYVIIRTPQNQVRSWIDWGRTLMRPAVPPLLRATRHIEQEERQVDDQLFIVLLDAGLDITFAQTIVKTPQRILVQWLQFAVKQWW
ncbi:MAG: hypothetical protein WCV62_00325 [Candidatus Peribacteraceae bacterium]|jgi:hypothetical protein